jgi:hypothetical protein
MGGCCALCAVCMCVKRDGGCAAQRGLFLPQGPRLGEDGGTAKAEPPLSSLPPPFPQVIEKLSKHGFHRLYVVDPEEKPVGIITCTDVLSKLVQVAFQ